MKAIVAAATLLLLTLAGCDKFSIGGGNTNQSGNAAASTGNGSKDSPGGNQSASAASGDKDPVAGAAPASGAPALDSAYVTGRWTDNGDCGNSVEFAGDGQFQTTSGSGGLWNLAGDRLTMTGDRTLTLQIVPIDQNTMNVINPDGSIGRSTRC